LKNKGRGGRLGVADPRKNLVTFKVTNGELECLKIVSELFESRSEMIRIVLFDFAFALPPEKAKDLLDPESFERLKDKIRNGE